MKPTDILHPEQRRPSKAYLVNELRKAVYAWRKEGYPGTTPTTKRLLQFWFFDDNLVNNEPFQFWFCQREGIETLIYIYEVMKKHNFIDMASDALATSMVFSLLSEPSFETPFSVATRAAAYVDHIDSHRYPPPWLALQYEIEWQEQHFVELLNADLQQGGVNNVMD